MISDEKLLFFNKEGFIPGPNETEKEFIERISITKKIVKDPKIFFDTQKNKPLFDLSDKVKKPRWNWTRAQLMNLFDISPIDLALFYSNDKLNLFQAAATWVIYVGDKETQVPILQFRKNLKQSTYLWIYTLDEILAHEAVHAARIAFDEPKTEEIFSYMTASSIFRKIMGPIVRNTKEVLLFFSVFSFYLLCQILAIISSNNFLSNISVFFGFCTFGIFLFGCIRLFKIRWKFNKTYKKLKNILKDKRLARAVLFRLTDKEIEDFSKMHTRHIKKFIQNKKNSSLRFRLINLAYFN